MSRNICIHHNDHDGHASAACVRLFVPVDAFIEMNYDRKFPWDKINEGDNVYMVDFSFPNFEEDMPRINELTNFHWIDHHKTAIDKAKAMNFKPSGGMIDPHENLAGCELTWKYLSGDGECIPKAVKLCGRFDVWDHEDPEVLPFHYGLEAQETNPATNWALWKELLSPKDDLFNAGENLVDRLINEGRVIEQYVDTTNARMARANSFPVDFEGHKWLAINHVGPGSKILEGIFDPSEYDGMLVFRRNNTGQWVVGLYAGPEEKIDCGEIAKRHKGGGHILSSGFVVGELPFEI